jgi:tRNA dimethylallyltransferase
MRKCLIQSINLLVVLGATATGKTRFGVGLARLLGGEIISADSRQVYKGFDIGSGKDLEEYDDVPYHLIDIVEPGYEFNLFEFQKRFRKAYSLVRSRGRLPLLVGGTGMYIDAVVNGYRLESVPENQRLREQLYLMTDENLVRRLQELQPQLHNTTDLKDRKRLIRAIEIAVAAKSAAESETEAEKEEGGTDKLNLAPLIFGVRFPRKKLRQRITARLKERLDNGLIEEVEQLHNSGLSFEKLDYYGLEYRFVGQYVQGLLNRNDMYQKLNSSIHQFAKRQETWYRRMEKRGTIIHWLDGQIDLMPQAIAIMKKYSNSHL